MRLQYGEAKVQFIANKSIIYDLLAKGWTYKMIYKELVAQKKITMKYQTLARLLYSDKENSNFNKVKQTKLIKSKITKEEAHISSEKRSFGSDNNKGLDDFI